MVSRMARTLLSEATIVADELALRNERSKGGRYDREMRAFARYMLVEFVNALRHEVARLRKKIKD
jgi:hypothetical protein